MTRRERQELIDQGLLLPLMEEFYTIQGEGFHKGTAAYFVRIGGCDVGCHWCDVKESWLAELHPPTETEKIVDNAVKYTEKGNITINIKRNENKNLVVEVMDTGIGIANDYLPNLFEPFSQEEMGYSRKYEGNGIGLTLVKKYCDLNSALIEVESKKNMGSVFRVLFSS